MTHRYTHKAPTISKDNISLIALLLLMLAVLGHTIVSASNAASIREKLDQFIETCRPVAAENLTTDDQTLSLDCSSYEQRDEVEN